MKDKDFEIAISQVNSILKHMSPSVIEKIPERLRSFLKENNKKEYNIDVRMDIPLTQQNINQKAINLLGVIYRNYWCEDIKAYDALLHKNQEKYNEELKKRYTIKFNT